MVEKFSLLGILGLLWAVILFLVNKQGNRQAKLEALKEEIKKQAAEQERANAISHSVDDMPIDSVRERLRNLPRD